MADSLQTELFGTDWRAENGKCWAGNYVAEILGVINMALAGLVLSDRSEATEYTMAQNQTEG